MRQVGDGKTLDAVDSLLDPALRNCGPGEHGLKHDHHQGQKDDIAPESVQKNAVQLIRNGDRRRFDAAHGLSDNSTDIAVTRFGNRC